MVLFIIVDGLWNNVLIIGESGNLFEVIIFFLFNYGVLLVV